MKKYLWEIKLAAILVSISAVIYLILFKAFGHLVNIEESVLNNLAFLPIYVLLVTLVVEQLINRKEKQIIISKLSPLIGLFFNEMGRHILREILASDKGSAKIKEDFHFSANNFDKSFKVIMSDLKNYCPDVDFNIQKLDKMRSFLMSKKEFILQLMENPNLLEHDNFTELILSVYHLYQELSLREDVRLLPEADYNHLNKDIERVQSLLLREWLYYLKYLIKEYPYLFSVELRTNPFSAINDVIIKE